MAIISLLASPTLYVWNSVRGKIQAARGGRVTSIANGDTVHYNGPPPPSGAGWYSIDAIAVAGTSGNDTIRANANQQSLIVAGDGNDYIITDSEHAALVFGGGGTDTVEINFGRNDDPSGVNSPANGFSICPSISVSCSIEGLFFVSSYSGGVFTLTDVEFLNLYGVQHRLITAGQTAGTITGTASDDAAFVSAAHHGAIKGVGGSDYLSAGSRISIDLLWQRYTVFAAGREVTSWIQGFEHVDGSYDNDMLFGDWKDNDLHGNRGNDLIVARAGNDRIWGDAGNDTLNGGLGADQLDGDDGADVFVFDRGDSGLTSESGDFISGFSFPEDRIDVSRIQNGGRDLVFLGNALRAGTAGVAFANDSGSNNRGLLSVDWNADGGSDMNIRMQLDQPGRLSARNFIF